jgi:glutamate synthase (NADPH/NADH) small chain
VLKLAPAPPVEIGRLQRYVTERYVGTPAGVDLIKPPGVRRTGRKVALVGGGPASLACASHLVSCGHDAVIFEKRGLPGGLNLSGIAPDKLHADDALKEAEWVLASGIELRTGVEVGRDVTCARLLEDYAAVFLGAGFGGDSRLGIPGEGGPGVYGAVETIERLKLDPAFRPGSLLGESEGAGGGAGAAGAMRTCDADGAVVIGGGNTATDVARLLASLGFRDVTILYRRTEKERPGYPHELEIARLAGVRFVENTLPVRVLREPANAKAECGAGAVGAAGSAGPLRGLLVADAQKAKPVPGTEREFPARAVFVAIGQAGLSGLLAGCPGVESDPGGRVKVDEKTGRTGNPRIFAGGDCVNGGREVVDAVAGGKRAAIAIDEMLR